MTPRELVIAAAWGVGLLAAGWLIIVTAAATFGP